MSKVIKLKKGLDIKLNGEAEKVVQPAGRITSCALKPTDFRAMTPKLAVKVGDEVKAGDVLFIDKTHPEIKFTTPVSGTITGSRSQGRCRDPVPGFRKNRSQQTESG